MTGTFRDVDHTRPMSHAVIMIGRVTEDRPRKTLSSVRSATMSASLGDCDRQDVIDALPKLAAIEQAKGRGTTDRR